MGGTLVRSIGLVRAKARIGLKNLACNMRRLVQLERLAMAGAPCEFRWRSLPEVGIEREIAPLGRGKPAKIPVKELPGWAKMA